MSRAILVARFHSLRPGILATLIAMSLTGGCASPCRTSPRTCCLTPPLLPTHDHPIDHKIEMDVSSVGPAEEVQARASQHLPASRHCYELTAAECQIQSAAHSHDAEVLEQRARDLEGAKHSDDSARVVAAVCRDVALHMRGHAAAEGLRLYFRLCEAEAQRQWVELAIAELDRGIEDHHRYTAQGLQLPLDVASLLQQRHTMRDRREALWLASAQLQGGLRISLGLCANDPQSIWPSSRLWVQEFSLDLPQTICEGLATRRDLSALRRLCRAESVTLDSNLGGLFAQFSPSLALQGVGVPNSPPGAAAQQSQICCTLAHNEQSAEEEIRQGVRSIESTHIRVALAREEVARTRQHLSDLEARRGADHVTLFDLVAARLRVYQAEGELVQQVVAWELAQVSFWEAMGLLVCRPEPIVAQTAPSAPLPPTSRSHPMPAESPQPQAYTPSGR